MSRFSIAYVPAVVPERQSRRGLRDHFPFSDRNAHHAGNCPDNPLVGRAMHTRLHAFRCWICFSLAAGATAFAASATTYQVTGPVVAVTPTTITVEKANENWEIARDPSSDSQADVKVGDRVTIHYRMHATKIELKPGKSEAGKDKDTATAKKRKTTD